MGLAYGVCLSVNILLKKSVEADPKLDRFPITTAARTAKSGLAIGLGYGLIQDALGVARGRTPAYVDFLRGKGRRQAGVNVDARQAEIT